MKRIKFRRVLWFKRPSCEWETTTFTIQVKKWWGWKDLEDEFGCEIGHATLKKHIPFNLITSCSGGKEGYCQIIADHLKIHPNNLELLEYPALTMHREW